MMFSLAGHGLLFQIMLVGQNVGRLFRLEIVHFQNLLSGITNSGTSRKYPSLVFAYQNVTGLFCCSFYRTIPDKALDNLP